MYAKELEPKKQNLQLEIKGMKCSSCALNLEKSLSAHPFVQSARVNFANRTAYVDLLAPAPQETLKKAALFESLEAVVKGLGFEVSPASSWEEREQEHTQEIQRTKQAAWICLGAAVFSMTMMHRLPWVQALFTTGILIFYARPFFKAVFLFLKGKSPNMNTLVGLGVLSSYLLSLYSLGTSQSNPFIYFETALFIVGFIHIGKWLEERARFRTQEATEALLRAQSKVAFVLRNGQYQEVEVCKIQIGDRLLIKAGEKVAVDGIIDSGSSYFDLSHLTGESLPKSLSKGDEILSGSLNLSGSIEMIAKRVGEESFLHQILKNLEEAQGAKPKIQKWADKVSAIFVPVVLGLSLLTAILWIALEGQEGLSRALVFATSVLVIACPCALGLATPTAIQVGTGIAAKRGIFFRNGSALENLNEVSAVIFDKTGTLTLGTPKLRHAFYNKSQDPLSSPQSWSIVRAVLERSHHPLSRALLSDLKTWELAPLLENGDLLVEEIPGLGIKAHFKGSIYRIGSLAFSEIQKHPTPTNDSSNDPSAEMAPLNSLPLGSQVAVSRDGKLLGVFVYWDPLKEGVFDLLQRLGQMGLKCYVLSGDHQQVLDEIFNASPQTLCKGNLSPKQKLEFLQELREKKDRVLMVGDGINDGPALAFAHVSMAMGTGSDVALAASDINLAGGRLSLILDTMSIASSTLKTIKRNLTLSFLYNVLAIPLAMGLLYPFTGQVLSPSWASLAMAMSSFSVVLSSLMLKRTIPKSS